MGKRGLPPSQLWLPWQPTAAAASGSSEGGGWKLGTGGREGMERRRHPPLGATGGSRGTSLGPHPRPRHPLELPNPAVGPGKAPNHIHTTLRWGRAPGKPSLAGACWAQTEDPSGCGAASPSAPQLLAFSPGKANGVSRRLHCFAAGGVTVGLAICEF